MRTTLKRRLAALTAVAAASVGMISLAAPAQAFDAGTLSYIGVAGTPDLLAGTNLDAVQVIAPSACSASATRHYLSITSIVATDPTQQATADGWVGQLLYSPLQVGLPGPLNVQSSDSWKGWADTYSLPLVPGKWNLRLRCQNNLGNVVYEEFKGSVTFSSPTAWSADVIAPTKRATTTALTAAPNPVEAGANVALTATVADTDPAAPTNNVEFFDGATSLGTAPVDAAGVATLTKSFTANASLTAKYAGDATFETSTSAAVALVVNAAPAAATTTALTVDPLSGPEFQSVTLTGKVTNTTTPATIPVGTCDFFDGARKIGSVAVSATGDCAFTSAGFGSGDHNFSVKFVGANGFSGSESAVVKATYAAVDGTVTDPQNVVVTVPKGKLTIFTPYTPSNPLNLGDLVLSADGKSFSASGAFDKVTITDTRAGNPGWTASLIRSDFTGPTPADVIAAKYSGFIDVLPAYIAGNAITNIATTDIPANDPAYAPGPAPFAKAVAGQGTGSVDVKANFVLQGVPTSVKAGVYNATVTFTLA